MIPSNLVNPSCLTEPRAPVNLCGLIPEQSGCLELRLGYFSIHRRQYKVEFGLMRKQRRPEDEAAREFIKSISLVTQIGITMMFGIGLGFAGGYFADRWLETGHFCLIIGICMGIGAGFLNVYRVLQKGFLMPTETGKRDNAQDDKNRNDNS